MVNGIDAGPRSPAVSWGRNRPAAETAAGGAGAAVLPAPAAPSTLAHASAALAARPPVDQPRVEQLRAAIAAGHYVIDPGAIADAMIAHELGSPSAG
jgi:flagellar biosynthesis anti-sigma factor FlgM